MNSRSLKTTCQITITNKCYSKIPDHSYALHVNTFMCFDEDNYNVLSRNLVKFYVLHTIIGATEFLVLKIKFCKVIEVLGVWHSSYIHPFQMKNRDADYLSL